MRRRSIVLPVVVFASSQLLTACMGTTATANVTAPARTPAAVAALAATVPGGALRAPAIATGDPRTFQLSAADARASAGGDDDEDDRGATARGAAPASTTGARQEPPWQRCTAAAGEWSGYVTGNDPHADARVTLSVAPDCRVVQGVWRWRSRCSGAVDRTVAGEWDPTARALVLRDVALTNAAPRGRARFCTVDRYQLTLSADGARLDGAYDAAGCRDHARIELHRAQ